MRTPVETPEVAADDCYRCGYDLRGVADDQPCPECGLLAGRSRRPSDELHHTRPGWLRRLAWGLRLMLLAVLLLPLWPVVVETLQRNPAFVTWGPAGMNVPPFFALRQHAMLAWGDLAVLLFVAGVLLLTSREGYAPADRADLARRRLLRLATVPLLAAAVLMHVGIQLEVNALIGGGMWTRGNDAMQWAGWAAFLLVTFGMVPLPILLMYQLRSLAKRARHPQLAEDCAIVGVGNAVTLLYVPVVTFVMNNAHRWGLGSNWTSRSTGSLLLVLVLGVLSCVFAFWNLYLLVRFWLAFSRASRMLRSEWRRDDRSVDPAAAAGA